MLSAPLLHLFSCIPGAQKANKSLHQTTQQALSE